MAANIQLSVEESLEFAKFDARWEGFLAGAMAARDFAKRQRISELAASKKAPTVMPAREEAV